MLLNVDAIIILIQSTHFPSPGTGKQKQERQVACPQSSHSSRGSLTLTKYTNKCHFLLTKITLIAGREQTVGREDLSNLRSGQSNPDLNEMPGQLP